MFLDRPVLPVMIASVVLALLAIGVALCLRADCAKRLCRAGHSKFVDGDCICVEDAK